MEKPNLVALASWSAMICASRAYFAAGDAFASSTDEEKEFDDYEFCDDASSLFSWPFLSGWPYLFLLATRPSDETMSSTFNSF